MIRWSSTLDFFYDFNVPVKKAQSYQKYTKKSKSYSPKMQKNNLLKGETVEEWYAKVYIAKIRGRGAFKYFSIRLRKHSVTKIHKKIFAPKMQKLICQKGIAFKKCSLWQSSAGQQNLADWIFYKLTFLLLKVLQQ